MGGWWGEVEEGWRMESHRTELFLRKHARLVRTDLRGEPVTDGVHVVAGRRGAHEGVGVAGEAVAVG